MSGQMYLDVAGCKNGTKPNSDSKLLQSALRCQALLPCRYLFRTTGTVQGQGQNTNGQHSQNSYKGRATHVLCVSFDVE